MSRSNYILFIGIISCPVVHSEPSALAIEFLSSVAKGAFAVARKLPDGSQIIEIAAKIPGKTALTKRAVEVVSKNPKAAIITTAGVLTAAKNIVEVKIAETGVDGAIKGGKIVYEYAKKEAAKTTDDKEEPNKETIENTQVGL